jgi:hypothetical protein
MEILDYKSVNCAWYISSRSRYRGLVRPSTGEFEMLAAKGVDACNQVFPVTVAVWKGLLWFGGCQIEALVHMFGEIDVCLCESEIGLW